MANYMIIIDNTTHRKVFTNSHSHIRAFDYYSYLSLNVTTVFLPFNICLNFSSFADSFILTLIIIISRPRFNL